MKNFKTVAVIALNKFQYDDFIYEKLNDNIICMTMVNKGFVYIDNSRYFFVKDPETLKRTHADVIMTLPGSQDRKDFTDMMNAVRACSKTS